MKVYLVRHAIAHERNRARWPNDAKRPLTTAGKRKFRKAASGLASCLPKSVVVLTSPYLRARDTALILCKAASLRKPVECAELGADQPVRAAFKLLQARKHEAVVLVGHEPNLSKMLAAAVIGERSRLPMEFKKGGAACVVFERGAAPGRGAIAWIMPPRVLRSLR
jgi:phosphohistidine phosphatase